MKLFNKTKEEIISVEKFQALFNTIHSISQEDKTALILYFLVSEQYKSSEGIDEAIKFLEQSKGNQTEQTK